MPNKFGGRISAVTQSYDWSSTAPSTAVAQTVAEAVDESPTDIAPLYESIDTDALDAIIGNGGHLPRGRHRSLAFNYAGLWVTVDAAGMVSVDPP